MKPDDVTAVDLAVLAPDTTNEVLRTAVKAAVDAGLGSMTVNGGKTKFTSILAEGSGLRIATVVGGFPLGQVPIAVKPFEAALAVKNGTDEIDMMMNVGAFKECSPDYLLREIREVVAAAAGLPVKLVLESGLLTDEQKIRAALIGVDGGATAVVTASGYGPSSATAKDVALLRDALPAEIAVVAAGGIDSGASVTALLKAGAARARVTDLTVLDGN